MLQEITIENCEAYFRERIAHHLPYHVKRVIKVEEVQDQTYVNWIFRIRLENASGEVDVYLRQTKDRVKKKTDMKMDPQRIGFEVNILNQLQNIQPGITPKVLYLDKESNVAVLEDIKKQGNLLVHELLDGNVHLETAAGFGKVIGIFHSKTFGITHDRVRGNERANEEAVMFHLGMRLKPALEMFPIETNRLLEDSKRARSCLVLGDLSSKNMIVDGSHVRFLDLERAFVGDPAFDSAFLFCHYLIEVPPPKVGDSIEYIRVFMKSYEDVLRQHIRTQELPGIKNRIVRFLGVTILYRLFGFYLVVDVNRNKSFWKGVAGRLLGDSRSTSISDLLTSLILADKEFQSTKE